VPQIGGLNVAIGVDTSAISAGIKKALVDIKSFRKQVGALKLENIIKGDPFGAATKSIQASRKQLDLLNRKLNVFADNIKVNLGKAVDDSEKNAVRLTKEWNRAFKQIQKDARSKLLNLFQDISIAEGTLPAKEKLTEGVYTAIERTVAAIRRSGVSKELNKVFDMSGILKNTKMTTKEIEKELDMLAVAIKKDLGEDIRPVLENFAVKLEEAYKKQAGLELKNAIKQERDMALALKRRDERVNQLTVDMTRLQTELKAGIDVEQNRLALMKKIEEKEKIGIELTEKEIRLYKQLYSQQLKLPKFRGMPLAESRYEAELSNARNVAEAEKRRWSAIRQLRIEEARLRTEIKLNIDVEANRLTLYKNLARQQALLGRLDVERARELRLLSKEAAKVKARDGMFSPEWFKMRAGWFLQLRGYWAVYRGATQIVRDMVEYQDQLARAMRTARSEFMSNTEIIEKYGKAIREAVAQHGVDFKDVGETLYQLGSAGLTAEKNLAAFDKVLSLVVATEGDAREVTKAVAGLYNNFADQMEEYTTDARKFEHIINTISTVWQKHQVEISELVDGYKYASTAAKMAGVSFDKLSAILAVANDHMLKGPRAGRAFTTMLSRMARDSDKFAREFGLDKIDVHGVLDLDKIFGELHRRIKDGTASVAELEVAFSNLGIRATPLTRILIENWDDIKRAEREARDELVKSTEIEEKRLDSLGKQLEILGKRFGSGFLVMFQPIADAIKDFVGWMNEEIERIAKRQGKSYGEVMADVFINSMPLPFQTFFNFMRNAKTAKDILTKKPTEKKSQKKKSLDIDKEINGLLKKRTLSEEEFNKEMEQKLNKLDRELGIQKNLVDNTAKLVELRKEIDFWTKKEIEHRNAARRLYKESGFVTPDVIKEKKYELQAQKERLKLERQFNSIQSKVNQATAQTRQKIISGLREENELRSIRIRQINEEIRKMRRGGIVTVDEQEKINKLYDERTKLEKENNYNLLLIESILAHIKGTSSEIVELKHKERNALAEAKNLSEKQATAEERRRTAVRELHKRYSILLANKQKEIVYAKLHGKSEEIITKLQLETLQLRKEELEADLQIEKDRFKRLSLERQILDILTQQTELQDKLLALRHPILGAWKEMNREIEGTNVFIKNLSKDITIQFADGFSNALTQVMSGLANAKTSFKDFFKSLIMDINRTIMRWLIIKAILGIGDMVPGKPAAPATGWEAKFMSEATGGVIPEIESFRAFSQGGLTNRPTLAVLGDNPSKKEIVIPEENIQDNSVSGYVREQGGQGITIINAITKEDIANAMASTSGQRVIINTIGKDINQRGSTAKLIKTL